MPQVSDDNAPVLQQQVREVGDRFVQQLNETKSEIMRAFVEIAVRTELGLRVLDRAEMRLDRLEARVGRLENGDRAPRDESRQIELFVVQ